MKRIDYLRMLAIEEKIMVKSGSSIEQINRVQEEAAADAIARLNTLNLPLPFPSHPNAICIYRSPACRGPSYADLCLVKSIFIGEERTAIQVFPKLSEHVNDHSTCLHLWACLESDALPDFSWFGTV